MSRNLASQILKNRRLSLAILGVLTLFFGIGLKRIGVDFSFDSFFPREDDYEFYMKFQKLFPNDDNIIHIALLPEDGNIFDKNFIDKSEALFENLRSVEYVDSVVSPANLPYITRTPTSVKNEPILQWQNAEEIAESKKRIREDSLVLSAFISEDGKIYNALVIIDESILDLPQRDSVSTDVRETVEASGMKHVISGIPYIRSRYVTKITDELIYFVSTSTLLILLILFLMYRSVWGIIVPTAGVLVAMVWCIGLMGWTNKAVDLMFELFPPIMFVVGTSDIIHLVTKYTSELREGTEPMKAMEVTLGEIGAAILLTSLTTAVGFGSLVVSGMRPIRDFGIYSAVGVLFAYIVAIILIPNVLLMVNPDKIRRSKGMGFSQNWDKLLNACYEFARKRQLVIVLGLIGVLTFSGIGMSKISFNTYLLDDVHPNDPIRADMIYFEENFDGIRPFEMAIIPEEGHMVTDLDVLTETDKLDNFIATTGLISPTLSPASLMKSVNKIWKYRSPRQYKLPKSQAKVDELIGFIRGGGGEQLLETVWSEDANMGRLTGRMPDIGTERFDNLQKAIQKFYVTSCDTNLMSYRMTGSAMLAERNNIYLRESLVSGLLLAFGLIAILMGVMFKSVRMLLIALIPNFIPVLFTAGVMGYLGISMRASSSITFVIAFGIAVDDTIHFLSRYRLERRMGRSLEEALQRTVMGTGKALIMTTVILLSGFCLLLTSDFGGTFIVGLFVLLALVMGLLSDFFVLPVLIRFGYRKSRQ